MNEHSTDAVRLDKWLWASRFFKSRKNAVEAINGGKVHLNGFRVKPSRLVRADDRLLITRDNYKYNVILLGVNDKRRPAKEAQLLYRENDESIQARNSEREMRKLNSSSAFSPTKKPSKKERRQINKWRDENF